MRKLLFWPGHSLSIHHRWVLHAALLVLGALAPPMAILAALTDAWSAPGVIAILAGAGALGAHVSGRFSPRRRVLEPVTGGALAVGALLAAALTAGGSAPVTSVPVPALLGIVAAVACGWLAARPAVRRPRSTSVWLSGFAAALLATGLMFVAVIGFGLLVAPVDDGTGELPWLVLAVGLCGLAMGSWLSGYISARAGGGAVRAVTVGTVAPVLLLHLVGLAELVRADGGAIIGGLVSGLLLASVSGKAARAGARRAAARVETAADELPAARVEPSDR